MIKSEKIGKKGFYTDGKSIYKKDIGTDILVMIEKTPSEIFIGKGFGYANASNTIDVRLVNNGELFYDGKVKVITPKELEIYTYETVGAKYDEKGYCINADQVIYKRYTKREVI